MWLCVQAALWSLRHTVRLRIANTNCAVESHCHQYAVCDLTNDLPRCLTRTGHATVCCTGHRHRRGAAHG
jgi:hypothetical protein